MRNIILALLIIPSLSFGQVSLFSPGATLSENDARYVQEAGDTMTGDLDMDGNSIINVDTMTVTGNQFSVGTSTFVVDNGRVGINNSNPVALLHVGAGVDLPFTSGSIGYFTSQGQTNVSIRDSASNVEMRLTAFSGGLIMGSATNHDLTFRTNNIQRMVIKNTGNFGIGVANPDELLHIDKGTGFGTVKADGSSGGCLMFRDTDDAGWTKATFLNGVPTYSIDADGICD